MLPTNTIVQELAMKRWISLLVLGGANGMTSGAFAQTNYAAPGHWTNPDVSAAERAVGEKRAEWQKLSPAEKQAKKDAVREKVKHMTPEERQHFKAERKAKWQERYDNATPEQKAKIDKRIQNRKERRASHPAR